MIVVGFMVVCLFCVGFGVCCFVVCVCFVISCFVVCWIVGWFAYFGLYNSVVILRH